MDDYDIVCLTLMDENLPQRKLPPHLRRKQASVIMIPMILHSISPPAIVFQLISHKPLSSKVLVIKKINRRLPFSFPEKMIGKSVRAMRALAAFAPVGNPLCGGTAWFRLSKKRGATEILVLLT